MNTAAAASSEDKIIPCKMCIYFVVKPMLKVHVSVLAWQRIIMLDFVCLQK